MAELKYINHDLEGQPPNTPSIYSKSFEPERLRFQQGPYGGMTEREPTLKDVVAVFRKRIKLILLCIAVCGLCGILYCIFADKYYTASADIEIQGYAPVLAGGSVDNLYGSDTRKLDYQRTTIAKLKRLVVADRALEDPDLKDNITNYLQKRSNNFFDYIVSFFKEKFKKNDDSESKNHSDQHFQFKPSLLQNYLGLIDISPVRDTSIVEISAITTDPELSQKIANAHSQAFIQELHQERQNAVMANYEVLQKQGKELQAKLSEAEHQLSQYAEKNQLVGDSNTEDANIAVRQVINLTNLLTDATAKRVKSESLLKELESKDDKLDNSAFEDQMQRSARDALEKAEAEYASLKQSVTDEYPAAKELKMRISSLKNSLSNAQKREIENLRIQYRSDVAAENKLIAKIDEARSKAQDMSKRLVQYNLLLKQSDSIRGLYETVLRQSQETQISGAAGNTNIIVSDYASKPLQPSAPHTNLVIIISFLLGGVIGLALAILLEAFNNKLRTPQDASIDLNLPLLGYVPSFSQTSYSMKESFINQVQKLLPFRSLSNKNLTPVQTTPPLTDGLMDEALTVKKPGDIDKASSFIMISSPQAMVSEALRTIRASILLAKADCPPGVIMTTSAQHGEGKTTITANLAIALAQSGHDVILIDADLRKSRIGSLFNISPDLPGLSDYLAGHRALDQVIRKTAVKNVDVLVAGSPSPNPVELLGSKSMHQLIDALKDRYQFILLDCAPVLPVADALMVSKISDAVLFITRSKKSDRNGTREACRRLRNVNAKILGVILNDLDLRDAEVGVGSMSAHDYNFQASAGFG